MYWAVHDEVQAKFGARVRKLREARGLTQEGLAADCRMDRTYLSGIERGRRNPSLRNIARLANQLGVTLAQFFRGI
jgi:transcriptional regulator with XRE-family HTH domain